MACDDKCVLNMGNTSVDPSTASLTLNVPSYTSYRNYYATPFIDLVEG